MPPPGLRNPVKAWGYTQRRVNDVNSCFVNAEIASLFLLHFQEERPKGNWQWATPDSPSRGLYKGTQSWLHHLPHSSGFRASKQLCGFLRLIINVVRNRQARVTNIWRKPLTWKASQQKQTIKAKENKQKPRNCHKGPQRPGCRSVSYQDAERPHLLTPSLEVKAKGTPYHPNKFNSESSEEALETIEQACQTQRLARTK